MAENDQQACEEPRGQQQHGGPLAFAVAVYTMINRSVAAVYHAANRDGTLVAAFRQGAGEIGQALKAFPDSIQVHEQGTILSPTASDIADARDSHAPSPGPIVNGNTGSVYGLEQTMSQTAPPPSDKGQATVHGPQQGEVQAPPSPGDVAKGNEQVLEQGKPPEMGYGEWVRQQEQPKTPELSYTEWLERQRKGDQGDNANNDQNDRERGRSLPEEQKEKEQERERGRDR